MEVPWRSPRDLVVVVKRLGDHGVRVLEEEEGEFWEEISSLGEGMRKRVTLQMVSLYRFGIFFVKKVELKWKGRIYLQNGVVRCPLPCHMAGCGWEREWVGLGEVCEWEMRWQVKWKMDFANFGKMPEIQVFWNGLKILPKIKKNIWRPMVKFVWRNTV